MDASREYPQHGRETPWTGSLDSIRVLIPAWDAIVGAGRVWVPYQRDLIGAAPRLWSLDELTPEFETETRRWYAAGKDHSGWAAHIRS